MKSQNNNTIEKHFFSVCRWFSCLVTLLSAPLTAVCSTTQDQLGCSSHSTTTPGQQSTSSTYFYDMKGRLKVKFGKFRREFLRWEDLFPQVPCIFLENFVKSEKRFLYEMETLHGFCFAHIISSWKISRLFRGTTGRIWLRTTSRSTGKHFPRYYRWCDQWSNFWPP
jgi:hypothetical protein